MWLFCCSCELQIQAIANPLIATSSGGSWLVPGLIIKLEALLTTTNYIGQSRWRHRWYVTQPGLDIPGPSCLGVLAGLPYLHSTYRDLVHLQMGHPDWIHRILHVTWKTAAKPSRRTKRPWPRECGRFVSGLASGGTTGTWTHREAVGEDETEGRVRAK